MKRCDCWLKNGVLKRKFLDDFYIPKKLIKLDLIAFILLILNKVIINNLFEPLFHFKTPFIKNSSIGSKGKEWAKECLILNWIIFLRWILAYRKKILK